jgi:hypothetical protein
VNLKEQSICEKLEIEERFNRNHTIYEEFLRTGQIMRPWLEWKIMHELNKCKKEIAANAPKENS